MARRRTNSGYRKEDLEVGSTFGHLEVIGPKVRGREAYFYPCMCQACGNPTFVRKGLLSDKGSASCGCRRGPFKHGGKRTRLYNIWMNMRDRCLNPACKAYPNYGGRGIELDVVWDDFKVFREWSLENGYEESLTIDRIDNNGPYSPDNCRWATRAVQSRNKRNNVFLTYDGVTKTLKDWSQDPLCTVSYHTLYSRIKRGIPMPDALVRPKYSRV